MKPGSKCCKPHSKATEEDEEEIQELTASPADTNKISMIAEGAAVSSGLDGIFALKDEQRAVLKAFLCFHFALASARV